MTDFERIAANFHKHEWVESELQFVDPLTCLEWSQNGKTALVGDLKGKLHSVDTRSGCPCPADCLSVGVSRVSDVSLNLSGDIFASTSTSSHNVVLGNCDSDSGNFSRKTVSLPSQTQPLCVSFMQDEINGQNLLLVGDRQGIRLIDAHSGALFRQMTHNGGCTSLHSWNGCMVAGGSSDGTVSLWDARSREPIAHFGTKNSGKKPVFSVDASARLLATTGATGAIQLYDISTRRKIEEKKVMEDDIRCLNFSPSFRYLAVADKDSLSLVNLNEIILGSTPFPTKEVIKMQSVTGVRWHPDQCSLLSRSTDRKLRLYQPVIED